MKSLMLVCLGSVLMITGCSTTELNNASKVLGNGINTVLAPKPTMGNTLDKKTAYLMEYDMNGNRLKPNKDGWQPMLDTGQGEQALQRNIYSMKRDVQKDVKTFESKVIYRNSATALRQMSKFTSQLDNYTPNGKEYYQSTHVVDCKNKTYRITNARLYSPAGKLMMYCPISAVGGTSLPSEYEGSLVNYFCK